MEPLSKFKINRLQIWLSFVFLFGLSLLTSKSALTFTSTILILWAFFDPTQRAVWTKDKKILFLVSLFPIAIILNLFSVMGYSSSLKVITSWSWPLFAAPTLIIFNDLRARKILAFALAAGLLLSNVYSLYLLYENLIHNSANSFMTENFRIGSFWNIGRWGVFSGFSVLTLFLILHENVKPKLKNYLTVLLGMTSFSFLLSNTRGPLAALIIILSLLSFTDKRILKNALIMFSILFTFFIANDSFSERIRSIFSVNLNTEKLTSTNQSNASRLDMWKVAFDFYKEQPLFGTGFENTKVPLENFLEKMGPEYTEKYTKAEFSYNDQHSSYLNILIQMGIFFFIYCWGGILIIFLTQLKKYFSTKDTYSRLFLAGIIYNLIVSIFYSSFSSYESILLIIPLALVGKKNATSSVTSNL
ncbi:MAG: hypothetical protein A2622_10950 [Bdellovibrionales bacterium RIFCSPHIGHO2_01_FULL_40_29]|nr:MAG: hypothetical protein A2622_10950 [Bdellovibrionales bacterium RIFCSPHIGHO2_01_FULL_40_29]OFZ34472.1 MAG: hypothetical protein A3D17_01215 [Bdellovibrionales bacterium RIFCSPHIGHO2_02_FULL_40_15]